MAPYNPFPTNYQPLYPMYQPGTAWQMQNPYMANQQQGQAAPQAMTPPTIHADIIQVENEAEADRFPMAQGSAPQMFLKRDEQEIYIKTMLANGEHELAVYAKRPPRPAVDMGQYVTKEELEKKLEWLHDKIGGNE